MKKFLKEIREGSDERYLESLRILKKQDKPMAKDSEESEHWVGPYKDDSYTWGRVSGTKVIDSVLAAATGGIGLLLLEILRQTSPAW